MQRLFNNNSAEETNIVTKVTLSRTKKAPQSYESDSESVTWRCIKQEDFEKVYDRILSRIEKGRKEISPNITVEIGLTGKLKGNEVKEVFQNIDSYRNFLENNALLSNDKERFTL